MCSHSTVKISPTPENSWGIEDTYHVICPACGTTLFPGGTIQEIRDFVNKNKYTIQSGEEYLSQDC